MPKHSKHVNIYVQDPVNGTVVYAIRVNRDEDKRYLISIDDMYEIINMFKKSIRCYEYE